MPNNSVLPTRLCKSAMAVNFHKVRSDVHIRRNGALPHGHFISSEILTLAYMNSEETDLKDRIPLCAQHTVTGPLPDEQLITLVHYCVKCLVSNDFKAYTKQSVDEERQIASL